MLVSVSDISLVDPNLSNRPVAVSVIVGLLICAGVAILTLAIAILCMTKIRPVDPNMVVPSAWQRRKRLKERQAERRAMVKEFVRGGCLCEGQNADISHRCTTESSSSKQPTPVETRKKPEPQEPLTLLGAGNRYTASSLSSAGPF